MPKEKIITCPKCNSIAIKIYRPEVYEFNYHCPNCGHAWN